MMVVLLQINRFSTSAIFINVSHFFSFQSLSFFTLLFHQVLGSTIEDTAGGSAADQ
jgi:uncharacterized membrane protein YeiH